MTLILTKQHNVITFNRIEAFTHFVRNDYFSLKLVLNLTDLNQPNLSIQNNNNVFLYKI